ncbi:hypothetical protein NDU88_003140 [Pleurodeles waltl]|uniref:Uncharacterized protein n=1 Tax=Pleurodeles waltl TaxID=8319 RepID=A0AAV7UBX6_PLEWA|nr:hypothetical protein NDU88_003140 [Pleurodeles waltl]
MQDQFEHVICSAICRDKLNTAHPEPEHSSLHRNMEEQSEHGKLLEQTGHTSLYRNMQEQAKHGSLHLNMQEQAGHGYLHLNLEKQDAFDISSYSDADLYIDHQITRGLDNSAETGLAYSSGPPTAEVSSFSTVIQKAAEVFELPLTVEANLLTEAFQPLVSLA